VRVLNAALGDVAYGFSGTALSVLNATWLWETYGPAGISFCYDVSGGQPQPCAAGTPGSIQFSGTFSRSIGVMPVISLDADGQSVTFSLFFENALITSLVSTDTPVYFTWGSPVMPSPAPSWGQVANMSTSGMTVSFTAPLALIPIALADAPTTLQDQLNSLLASPECLKLLLIQAVSADLASTAPGIEPFTSIFNFYAPHAEACFSAWLNTVPALSELNLCYTVSANVPAEALLAFNGLAVPSQVAFGVVPAGTTFSGVEVPASLVVMASNGRDEAPGPASQFVTDAGALFSVLVGGETPAEWSPSIQSIMWVSPPQLSILINTIFSENSNIANINSTWLQAADGPGDTWVVGQINQGANASLGPLPCIYSINQTLANQQTGFFSDATLSDLMVSELLWVNAQGSWQLQYTFSHTLYATAGDHEYEFIQYNTTSQASCSAIFTVSVDSATAGGELVLTGTTANTNFNFSPDLCVGESTSEQVQANFEINTWNAFSGFVAAQTPIWGAARPYLCVAGCLMSTVFVDDDFGLNVAISLQRLS
jgi:hypothetical protein